MPDPRYLNQLEILQFLLDFLCRQRVIIILSISGPHTAKINESLWRNDVALYSLYCIAVFLKYVTGFKYVLT